eukprot:5703852-Alexandrium_andersonii.AAC.1
MLVGHRLREDVLPAAILELLAQPVNFPCSAASLVEGLLRARAGLQGHAARAVVGLQAPLLGRLRPGGRHRRS